MKAAIMGFGTIGSGVLEVLEKNRDGIGKRAGEPIEVKYILDLREFPGNPAEKMIVHDFSVIENDGEISIVVETMGGTKPAYDFVRRCLLAGKHVVTSNKALVAAHGTELLEIAAERNVNFFFEASAGGGIPIIRPLYDSLAGEEILEICGILNGTTNFILTKMAKEGSSFDDALKEAQDLGYAERDPSADVEGHDTCRKLAILAAIAEGHEADYKEIPTEGITGIAAVDFQYAKKLGASIKLLGRYRKRDQKVYAGVAPVMINAENPLYAVNGVYNGIMVTGNMLGRSMFYGSGAGKLPTASAVVGDMIAAAIHKKEHIPMGWNRTRMEICSAWESGRSFFARFEGSYEEKKDLIEAAYCPERPIVLAGLDEFAVVTKPMTKREFDAAAEKIGGLRQRIVAEV